MRPYGELSKDQEPLLPRQFCSDCIIATRGYDFREGQGSSRSRSDVMGRLCPMQKQRGSPPWHDGYWLALLAVPRTDGNARSPARPVRPEDGHGSNIAREIWDRARRPEDNVPIG